jgi:hypothetical protein
LGGQDESLKVNQDVDLLFRILLGKNKIKGIPGPKALIREHNSERVGKVGISGEKLMDIFNLRMRFKAELQKNGLLNSEAAERLARYCFGYWTLFRKSHPAESALFLDLSKKLYPKLKVRGGIAVKVLNLFFSAEKTILIKQTLKNSLTGNKS